MKSKTVFLGGIVVLVTSLLSGCGASTSPKSSQAPASSRAATPSSSHVAPNSSTSTSPQSASKLGPLPPLVGAKTLASDSGTGNAHVGAIVVSAKWLNLQLECDGNGEVTIPALGKMKGCDAGFVFLDQWPGLTGNRLNINVQAPPRMRWILRLSSSPIKNVLSSSGQ